MERLAIPMERPSYQNQTTDPMQPQEKLREFGNIVKIYYLHAREHHKEVHYYL